MGNEKVWVSDVISREEIERWEPGAVVTVRAKTGDGKSYFVKHELYEFAKERGAKILFLLHRTNTIEQFVGELERDGKTDTITVRTYQFYEEKLLHGCSTDLEKFEYVVVDECHYFVSDAAFNDKTDLSFGAIINQTGAVRILMSATIDDIRDYICTQHEIKTVDYVLPENYGHIQRLTFFDNDDMLDELARRILEAGEKGIFFVQRARKAFGLYTRFKNVATFNCSKSNVMYRYVDENAINKMLLDERFETPLLVTTSCLDTGANIVDTEVKHIVVDMRDVDVIIQCAGRKRIQSKSDTVALYVKNISNQQLGGYESSANKKLRMARYLMSHSTQELIERFPRQNDASGVIYDSYEDGHLEKRVNRLMFLRKTKDIELYGQMKELGDHGFAKYLARKFGFMDEKTGGYWYYVEHGDSGIMAYLDRMVGVTMLTRTDRKELIDRLDVRQNGHQLRELDSLNSALRERHLPYRITQFQTSRVENGKKKNFKAAWRVEKTKEEIDG